MALPDEVVLVVDDDPLQLEILADDLALLGVGRVILAESGEVAAGHVRADKAITTILTDINMPNMDGAQFMRELAGAGCGARIVLVSGASVDIMHSLGNLGRSHGLRVIGFIQKPVRPDALKALLQRPTQTDVRARTRPVNTPAPDIDLSPERLRVALAKREIHPWYQPKVDINHLRLTGVEALARWRLPDGTLVSPGDFVPAIEHTGLAIDLFFCMFMQVLTDVRRWRDSGRTIKASVNLSMDCAFQLDLPDKIGHLLAEAGVAPQDIIIEVTESQLMENKAAALETLTRISLLGCVLSIDDFGTGYSSLAQVVNLPFGELKLDGSFVQQAGISVKADAILRSTITLGRSLGMGLVAEGVETAQQLDVLRAMGGAVVQGFLISRPLAAPAFEEWLDQWRPGLIDKPGCTRPFTLLVADDELSMRLVIEAEMKQQMPDAHILLAESGEQALELARSQFIDAATIDVHMPGMNGLELLGHLRNRRPAARLALVTADATEAVAQEATRQGALYCLKPLTDAQAERIARHFTKH